MSQTNKYRINKRIPKQLTWPYRPKNGVFNGRDVYTRMVFKMMREDPTIKRSFDRVSKFMYQSIYKHENGKIQVVADWMKFQVISEVMFWLFSEALIAGWPMNFGKIGYLRAFRFKANEKTLNINWKATNQYLKENNLPPSCVNMIFYQPEDYCAIRLRKVDSFSGTGRLRFTIASFSRNKTAMKDKFARALTQNKLLQNRYREAN